MMRSFFFRWIIVRRLRKQQNLPYKLKNEGDSVLTSCVLAILKCISPSFSKLKSLCQKLAIKDIAEYRCLLRRDDFGNELLQSRPLFTQNIISKTFKLVILYAILVPVFTLCEGAMYLPVTPLFVPGASDIIKCFVALFLATASICILDYGFEQHFSYKNAKEKQRLGKISLTQLDTYREGQRFGQILIILVIVANIACGCCRFFFLENINVNGLSNEKLNNLLIASKFSAIITLCLTLAASLFLAAIRYQQTKLSVQFSIFLYWRKTHKRRNKYSQELIRCVHKILSSIEQYAQSSYQLSIDLKRVFQTPEEFDEKYTDLNAEYLSLRSNEGFVLTDHLYQRFSALQTAYKELFFYGIRNEKEIKTIILYCHYSLRLCEEHIASQLPSTTQHSTETKLLPPPSLNGKAKSPYQFF